MLQEILSKYQYIANPLTLSVIGWLLIYLFFVFFIFFYRFFSLSGWISKESSSLSSMLMGNILSTSSALHSCKERSEKIDKYFYKCVVKFDFTGKYYFKVTYKDERIGGGIITIAENILEKIYEMEFGTWEIKDNKMHFYDTKGNLLASFALYDNFGNPSSESVFLRKKIDN